MPDFTVTITDEQWDMFCRFWLREVKAKYPGQTEEEFFAEELVDNAIDGIRQLLLKKLEAHNRPALELAAMWDGYERHYNLRKQAELE